MSMGREALDDILINDMMHEQQLEDAIANKIWIMAEGKEIKIHDMSQSHINNTINWLKNNRHFYGGEYLELLNDELVSRGLDDENLR